MTRIFPSLAILNLLGLLTAFVLGVVSRLRGGLLNLNDPIYLVHYGVGLYAVLATLLVHCLGIVNFLGTGRWVKEVCLAYGLPDGNWPLKTRDLKRATTPKAILAMLLTIATAAAGEADQHRAWPWWNHLVLASAALVVNAWVHTVQYRNIRINVGILEGVMADVERARAEQGLPSNAEALQASE
jgi:hypothetical protein